jgi:hypothetical protein
MIGALPPQPTIIETLTLAQEMPDDIRRQQDFLLDLFVVNGLDGVMLGEQQNLFQSIMHSSPLQGSAYE